MASEGVIATRYAPLALLAGRERRLLRGHPWVYANEVDMAAARALAPGALVRLASANGAPLGVAMINPHTLIVGRLLSTDADAVIDRALVAERIGRALALRERLFDRPFYRLIHAEADGLPALIVDRLGDVLVCQMNACGTEALRPHILAALDEMLAPQAIVVRSEGSARRLEGLEDEVAVVKGEVAGPVEISEGGLRFLADPLGGQKTGWFFDQRDNRAFIAGLASGCDVLDVYCYHGGFALAAAKRGARAVLGIDRSEAARALAARAAALNGLTDVCTFVRGQAFAELERLAANETRFDMVIADPPAFAKSRKDLGVGIRGYRKLARLAARLVRPGGIMMLSSCSHPVDREAFLGALARGLGDAGRAGRVIRFAGAAPDHPVHPHLAETAYLKCAVLALD